MILKLETRKLETLVHSRKLLSREIDEVVKFRREILIIGTKGSANGLDVGLEIPETHGPPIDIIVHFPEPGLVLVPHRFLVWMNDLVSCTHQHFSTEKLDAVNALSQRQIQPKNVTSGPAPARAPSAPFFSLFARAFVVCRTSTISSLSGGTGKSTLCSTVWFCTSSCGMICPSFAVSSLNGEPSSWTALKVQSGRQRELPKRQSSVSFSLSLTYCILDLMFDVSFSASLALLLPLPSPCPPLLLRSLSLLGTHSSTHNSFLMNQLRAACCNQPTPLCVLHEQIHVCPKLFGCASG